MFSFLQTPSKGTAQASPKDHHQQRLQEIGSSTTAPATTSDASSASEAGPHDKQLISSETGAVTAASARPAGGLEEFSTKIAQSLTEYWLGVLVGLEGQTSLDRERLQTAVANLDSLAGNVQGLARRLDPLSERADLLHRNYHVLSPRLFDAEQRVATSQRGIERLDEELGQLRELCQGVQKRVRTQGETTAGLEQTVRDQADSIGTHVKAALSQVGEQFEAFTRALDAHTEAIAKLDASLSRSDAAAQLLEQRLDRQAQAIQSVHVATQAQAERWPQLRDAAIGLAGLLHSPAGSRPRTQER